MNEEGLISDLLLPRLFEQHCKMIREAWLYLTPDQKQKIKDRHITIEKYWGPGDYYKVCGQCDEQIDMHPCSTLQVMEAFDR